MDGICILETGAASASASVLSDTQNLKKGPRMPTRFAPLFSHLLVRYVGRFALVPLVVRVKTEFLVFNSACFLFVDRVHVETLISSSAKPQATYKSVVTAQRLPAPRLITIRLGVRVIIETLPSPYTLVTIRNVPLTRVACI